MAKISVDQLIINIQKKYGKEAVVDYSAKPEKIDVISTRSLAIDIKSGIGGLPRGRIVEIYGPESSGKTTVALHAIAECQKQGGIAAFIDVEHAFDHIYASALGINVEKLIFCQPMTAEDALNIMGEIVASGAVQLVVLDSVAALVPKAELEGEVGESKMGIMARLMGQSLRMMTGNASKNNVCCIFINQLRDKIGILFGSPETTTGGNALKFFASMRLDVRKDGQTVKNKDGEKVANNIKVEFKKNKLAPPFQVAKTQIVYGYGISKEQEIVDLGEEIGVIERSGSWYGFNGQKLAQGNAQMVKFLDDNPDFADMIEEKIREYFFEPQQ